MRRRSGHQRPARGHTCGSSRGPCFARPAPAAVRCLTPGTAGDGTKSPTYTTRHASRPSPPPLLPGAVRRGRCQRSPATVRLPALRPGHGLAAQRKRRLRTRLVRGAISALAGAQRVPTSRAAVTYGEHHRRDDGGHRLAPRLGAAPGEMRRGEHPDDSDTGQVVAVVNTDWVLLGGDGRPARVPEAIATWFAAEPTFERSRVRLGDADRCYATGHPCTATGRGPHGTHEQRRLPRCRGRSDGAPATRGGLGLDPMARPVGRLYRVGYLQPALPGAQLDVAAWRPDAGSVACRIP